VNEAHQSTARVRTLSLTAAVATLGTAAALAGPAPAATLAGCPLLPRAFPTNQRVDHLPVLAGSDAIVRSIGLDEGLHPDFGSGTYQGRPIGIPYDVVGKRTKRERVRFGYDDESDRVRYPILRGVHIEGGRDADGDRHALLLDRDACRLYELFDLQGRPGAWSAGSGATWSLRSTKVRPAGWTSADAAGLPILPGLLRWREVRNRNVDHAIRFTTDATSRWHLWPARHDAGSRRRHKYPPMGARFRLKAGYSPRNFAPAAREVVRAMKTYGLVLADNGSPWFFQGERNAGWPDRLISDLKRIPASAFVAVDTRPLMVDPDSAQVQ
jgi:hypothetical protein